MEKTRGFNGFLGIDPKLGLGDKIIDHKDASVVVTKRKTEGNLTQILPNLDEKSRAILWYLWWHRHAEIAELRNLGDIVDDYDVLYRLKEIINKKSHDLWGKPIVGFEQSKIDALTGEKVLFSWWYLDEENAPLLNAGSALMDMFNEKDNVTIIAQLPVSVNLTAPDIQFKNGILKVIFKKTGFEDQE